MATSTLLLAIAVLFQSVLSNNQSNDCPTWMYDDDKTAVTNCVCGDDLRKVVRCEQSADQVQVLLCHGITYSQVYNTTVASNMPYTCHTGKSGAYYDVPKMPTANLSAYNCAGFNRDGQMCGNCLSSFSPPIYAYSLNCIKCDSFQWRALGNYICKAYLPVTLLYILVVIFKFRATDPVICEFIFACQIVSSSFVMTFTTTDLHGQKRSKGLKYMYLAHMVCGTFNLDFGRLIYEPICLHPDLSTHMAVALNYLIAVYPLLLILLTYFLVKLHDRYRLVVIICKPFHCCIKRLQKESNIKASLIHVFATFLLLSNVKLLNVSFDLISSPITLWNVTGHSLPHKYTYLNGSLEYLGKDHLPYFVLGVIVIIVFNMLPTLLLCLYPFRWFQRCLNHCHINSPSLRIFMDAFQGGYKITPRDYRHMAALPFIIRLLNFVLFAITINQLYYTLFGFLLLVVVSIMCFTLPFKSTLQNLVSIQFLLVVATCYFFVNTSEITAYSNSYAMWYVYIHIVGFISTLPFLTMAFYYLRKLFRLKIMRKLVSCFKVHLATYSTSEVENAPASPSTSELPALREVAAQQTEFTPLVS